MLLPSSDTARRPMRPMRLSRHNTASCTICSVAACSVTDLCLHARHAPVHNLAVRNQHAPYALFDTGRCARPNAPYALLVADVYARYALWPCILCMPCMPPWITAAACESNAPCAPGLKSPRLLPGMLYMLSLCSESFHAQLHALYALGFY
jgi:hypothetical protein